MTEPVSLEELKDHLRLDQGETGEDIYLETLIAAARRACENAINRSIVGREMLLSLDAFPAPRWGAVARGRDVRTIFLPGGTVTVVGNITYHDAAGATVTVAPETYVVDLDWSPAKIEPVNGWPAASGRVRIRYEVSPLDCEEMSVAAQAIKLLVGQWYVNRESVVTGLSATELPLSVSWLLRPLRQFAID